MTRRSRRELEQAIEDLTPDRADTVANCCPGCGGLPPGSDEEMGVTAPFVTYECTCNRDTPPGVVTFEGGGGL